MRVAGVLCESAEDIDRVGEVWSGCGLAKLNGTDKLSIGLILHIVALFVGLWGHITGEYSPYCNFSVVALTVAMIDVMRCVRLSL